MIVESPEVLDGAERDDRPLVLLPGAGAVVLEEPQSPRVLYGNIDSDISTGIKLGTFLANQHFFVVCSLVLLEVGALS